ncbi:MAG: PaaX family transcriptional regulator C-terminal domain-containing protein [Pseudolabrys sp.]|nr:PaaX family transcriptional regulator C-terminal domain-containing protein [Pseudolabrys sp.]MDP2297722.1 PaaX family transcriptional regulator C-terminal domain-containing protein [Pseudolabrys sp.]
MVRKMLDGLTLIESILSRSPGCAAVSRDAGTGMSTMHQRKPQLAGNGSVVLFDTAMTISAAVATLLDQFHAKRPVRAWSLIITLYGDAIVPRGGSLWLGSLSEIMALFRVDAGHVRTAMSRLTADGWLKRVKVGRNSYYRLTRREEGSFTAATQRIYFAGEPAFDGRLRLALLGPGAAATARPALEHAGFAALTANAYVAFGEPRAKLPDIDGLFLLRADADEEAHALAAAAWKLGPIALAYRDFIDRFTPLDTALARRSRVEGDDALVARILLIHEFRRVVLRDPGLPAALLPADWPGAAARQLAGRLYRRLLDDSEAYLDVNALDQEGPLSAIDGNLRDRFVSK